MKSVGRYVGRSVRGLGRNVSLVVGVGLLTALPPYRPTALSAQETSLTIYSDGRLLVRRTFAVTVPSGPTTIPLDLGVREVNPGSVVALDDGVQVTGSRLAAATGLEGSLRRAVGAQLLFHSEFSMGVRYSTGRLLSVEPLAIQVDSGIVYSFPGTPVFPQALVQLAPRFELSLESARAANSLRLLYQSSGLAWAASYAVMVPRGGAGQSSVTGTAEIVNNAGIAMTGAQVQLLAGDVRSAPSSGVIALRARANMAEEASVVTGEAVGGTHVYSLPGSFDFVPGETRTLALFPRTTAAVETELVLQAMGYGIISPWPEAQRDLHPSITYVVRRPSGADGTFGATALPAGVVRVYEPDSSGRQQLLGEVGIDHTPAGRDLRLTTGTAFDITATKTQTAYERRGDREAVSAYRVELRNAGRRAATVAVLDVCPRDCDIVSSSIRGEKPSAQSLRFVVPVPAGGTATLDYRIHARW